MKNCTTGKVKTTFKVPAKTKTKSKKKERGVGGLGVGGGPGTTYVRQVYTPDFTDRVPFSTNTVSKDPHPTETRRSGGTNMINLKRLETREFVLRVGLGKNWSLAELRPENTLY